jgi:hypothetical protein
VRSAAAARLSSSRAELLGVACMPALWPCKKAAGGVDELSCLSYTKTCGINLTNKSPFSAYGRWPLFSRSAVAGHNDRWPSEAVLLARPVANAKVQKQIICCVVSLALYIYY